MDFWIKFWTFFFFANLALFAGLALFVSIGGFFNIHSLFKSLTGQADQQDKNSCKKDDSAGLL